MKKISIYWPGSFQLDWWMQIQTTSTTLKATGTCELDDKLTVTDGNKDAPFPGDFDGLVITSIEGF